MTSSRPLVIAHRGASGLRPEHTLEGYQLAVEQGADVIEPDVVMTADGVAIARHDVHLSTSTDIAERPEFSSRRRVDADHGPEADWFVTDFSLAEIKSLHARQPFADRDQSFNDRFRIPTLREIIDLVLAARRGNGRPLLVYPETKAPSWHRKRGLELGNAVLFELERAGLNHDEGGVLIQSFEIETLLELAPRTPLPRVLLVAADSQGSCPIDPASVAPAAPRGVNGLGVDKALLQTEFGGIPMVEAAHHAGLFVHAWTFRDDRLPSHFDDPIDEIHQALDAGIDAFFTDFPATGRAAVDSWRSVHR